MPNVLINLIVIENEKIIDYQFNAVLPSVYSFRTGTTKSKTCLLQKLPDPEIMKPEMTEIWDPEVKIIQPGATNWDAPSDAIVLV